jgi:hypothetical protein
MPCYGKYRGTIVSSVDPLQLGRVQLSIPDVLGAQISDWALPCLPPGPVTVLPPVGALVWVEFERGDPSQPIWCGLFWQDPTQLPDALRQPSQDDTLSLRTRAGAGIHIGPAGIVIENGKGARITLQGPSVSINDGALAIT